MANAANKRLIGVEHVTVSWPSWRVSLIAIVTFITETYYYEEKLI